MVIVYYNLKQLAYYFYLGLENYLNYHIAQVLDIYGVTKLINSKFVKNSLKTQVCLSFMYIQTINHGTCLLPLIQRTDTIYFRCDRVRRNTSQNCNKHFVYKLDYDENILFTIHSTVINCNAVNNSYFIIPRK